MRAIAHQLRADAAGLDADSAVAHANATTRRADLIPQDLAHRFDLTHPLAGPLLMSGLVPNWT
ncbi:hypothetical protein [Microbispora bryophytorum]|uniref:hypothetical protein n=1 Tax=Microbispora bryophytorum TaxID=1460882 RepID=UPI003723CA27